MASVTQSRLELVSRLFPQGVPRLWCPTLTHFSSKASPDVSRIEQHFKALAPYVRGILVPGSTGEGWEMSDQDILNLLPPVLDLAAKFDMRVLIGVLKTDTRAVLECIEQLSSFCVHRACVGLTICPPKGAGLSSNEISTGLRQVLQLGFPTALYQLPQVTENEMSPEVVQTLADEFANFYLFKDTSGVDRVASSDFSANVFMVRGSEQNGYAKWLREAGGRYDGFLLSTANSLAPQLSQIISLISHGQIEAANELSEQISRFVSQAFGLVQSFPAGNAFTNTNKLLDHHRAFGKRAKSVPPPLLYSGVHLPNSLVEQAGKLLNEFKLADSRGYCDQA